MPDHKAYELLKRYKIPIAKFFLAKNSSEAVSAAKKLGFPVVLKIDGDVIHKKKANCVEIAKNEKDIHSKFKKIMKNAKAITKNIHGVIVQEFVKGKEVIVGAKRDPQFGIVIMFGSVSMGEKDIVFRINPSKKEISDMMRETKVYEMIKDFKKRKTIKIKKMRKTLPLFEKQVDVVCNVILRVLNLMKRENIKEMDINPLFVSKKMVMAADVRIII